MKDRACAEDARQHLCSQGQAPAAIWWGAWLQTNVLIKENKLLMNGEEGGVLPYCGTLQYHLKLFFRKVWDAEKDSRL